MSSCLNSLVLRGSVCVKWDTAGQERFHVITRTFFKGAHGIVIIYDLTDNDSFRNVNYWMANIQQHADEKVYIYMCMFHRIGCD